MFGAGSSGSEVTNLDVSRVRLLQVSLSVTGLLLPDGPPGGVGVLPLPTSCRGIRPTKVKRSVNQTIDCFCYCLALNVLLSHVI